MGLKLIVIRNDAGEAFIEREDGDAVATMAMMADCADLEYARRLVAAFNACGGIKTKDLETMGSGTLALLFERHAATWGEYWKHVHP